MKKKLIITLATIVILTILIFGYNEFFGYKSTIKQNFGIDLNFDRRKIEEKEEWSPNGDGNKIQIFKYKTLTNLNKNLYSNLPIKEELRPNKIPKQFTKTINGYYKYIIDENDNRNFNILIIDTLSKEICVYYQIM